MPYSKLLFDKQQLAAFMLNIFQHSHVALSVADVYSQHHPFIYVNKSFTELTGYTQEESLGKNCNFLQGEERNQIGVKLMAEAIHKKQGCRVVVKNFRKDGSPFWNEVTLIPITMPGGDTPFYVGMQIDVTAQLEYHNLEYAYDVINKQLETLADQATEIELINTQLQERNRELQEIYQEKNDLIALVAHDLQNPLSAIFSYVEMTRDPHNEISQDDKLLYGNVAYETAERMLSMVRKLSQAGRLDYTRRTETGLYAFNMVFAVQSLVKSYELLASQKGITIACNIMDEPIQILAEETIFNEIVENLLSNALKYSKLNSTVTVSIQKANESAVQLRVQDEGLGIKSEEMPKLFSKYVKLSSRPTGGENSTGLGLYLVQKLAEQIRSKVWCESEYGHGACFIVEFQAAYEINPDLPLLPNV